MQITDLRERYGPQGRGYSAPSPKARSGSGTISSRALSHAPPATFHFRPDGGQRFALKNRCLPARYENRYLLLGDKSPPAIRRGRQSSERRLSQARSDRKDNADNRSSKFSPAIPRDLSRILPRQVRWRDPSNSMAGIPACRENGRLALQNPGRSIR